MAWLSSDPRDLGTCPPQDQAQANEETIEALEARLVRHRLQGGLVDRPGQLTRFVFAVAVPPFCSSSSHRTIRKAQQQRHLPQAIPPVIHTRCPNNHLPHVKQIGAYEAAIRGIAAGERDAAREVLEGLLAEPLLLRLDAAPAGGSGSSKRAASGANAGRSSSGGAHLAPSASQRRRLQRLRFLATKNLAPLLGATRAALGAACAAAALDPSDRQLWSDIAALAARLGDLACARRATERGLELLPRAVPLHERRVVLLGAVADWAGAAGALRALGRAEGTHPWW